MRGYLTHDEGPGDLEYCAVCGWQDDVSQLRFVTMAGANRLSLIEAQQEFLAASEHMSVAGFERDAEWRPFNEALDSVEVPIAGHDYGLTYADDATAYYYWRQRGL